MDRIGFSFKHRSFITFFSYRFSLFLFVALQGNCGCSSDPSAADDGLDGGGSTQPEAETDWDINTDPDTNFDLDGDGCYDEDCIVKTENDVRACQPFTCIAGNLEIDKSQIQTVVLPNLSVVHGGVFVTDNPSLRSLRGLENLEEIGMDNFSSALIIRDNPSLINLDGLEKISTLDGDMEIGQNSVLADLRGLRNLTKIGLDFELVGNQSLPNLSGLEALTAVLGGRLRIASNGSIENLQGLSNLSTLGGSTSVSISGNASLTNLQGLNGLVNVPYDLEIDSNDALVSLSGVENIVSIGAGLSIFNNPRLTALDSFAKLDSIGAAFWDADLDIYDNPLLPYCEICALIGRTSAAPGSNHNRLIGNSADACGSENDYDIDDLNCP